MKKIKAKQNIWGNWGIYHGSSRIDSFGERWNTVDHISDLLETGEYQLSPKSEITDADVAAHRERITGIVRRK